MKNNDLLIIGIGNEYRSDDAAGLIAARKIRQYGLKGIDVIENNGDGADLIEKWSGRKKTILIDAVLSGSEPGYIHEFTAPGSIIPSELFKFSTHLFSVPQAIYLSSSLGNLPDELKIFGIEAKSFGSGTVISGEVETAINSIVNLVTKLSRTFIIEGE